VSPSFILEHFVCVALTAYLLFLEHVCEEKKKERERERERERTRRRF
jgi:hypothetical protein